MFSITEKQHLPVVAASTNNKWTRRAKEAGYRNYPSTPPAKRALLLWRCKLVIVAFIFASNLSESLNCVLLEFGDAIISQVQIGEKSAPSVPDLQSDKGREMN